MIQGVPSTTTGWAASGGTSGLSLPSKSKTASIGVKVVDALPLWLSSSADVGTHLASVDIDSANLPAGLRGHRRPQPATPCVHYQASETSHAPPTISPHDSTDPSTRGVGGTGLSPPRGLPGRRDHGRAPVLRRRQLLGALHRPSSDAPERTDKARWTPLPLRAFAPASAELHHRALRPTHNPSLIPGRSSTRPPFTPRR